MDIRRLPWVMTQRWEDLLFAHWSVPPQSLRSLIPPGLTLDTFGNRAWLGITPFRVSRLRLRGLPPIPGLSSFAEINVRTYVTLDGKAGVYFFSLDAASAVAVAAARWAYKLPYFRAAFTVEAREDGVAYASHRRHRGAPPADFSAEYGPSGPLIRAVRGSLAWWLTERYCLYSVDRRGRLYRADIHHEPWPLYPARATLSRNTMAASLGIALSAIPEQLHFAPRLDVLVWPLVSVTRQQATALSRSRPLWSGQSGLKAG